MGTVLPTYRRRRASLQPDWGWTFGIIHKKPAEGGISAVGGTGSIYTYYGPDEPKFATLTENFLKKDLGGVMPALDLADEPLPLWWTTDFINSSPPGTAEQDESGLWVSSIAHAWASPNALYTDISAEDLAAAEKYGLMMGEKATGMLSK